MNIVMSFVKFLGRQLNSEEFTLAHVPKGRPLIFFLVSQLPVFAAAAG
jgi:hypothetical protein